jgi:protein-glutamine gamma-glutamyltransferase
MTPTSVQFEQRPSRLARLPRDTRDTFFLLAVIAWTVMPHCLHLPPWCAALTVLVLLWRARLAWVGGALPSRWVLVGVLLLVLGLTFWSYRSVFGKEPGVALVVSLMALKTLELRARRDAFVVFFLGFFLILTHFVFSQSLPIAVAMVISVWGLLTALVLAHMPVGQPALRHAAALAGRTALLGMPLMVVLFALFPRIGPLWGVPQEGGAGTGLSNSLRMGSVAEMALSDAIALRLRFFGALPQPQEQYFRGPVLTQFDGQEWLPMSSSSLGERGQLAPELQVQGPALVYEMTAEPLKLHVVPLLEASVQAPQFDGTPAVLTLSHDLQWRAEQRLFDRVRLTAQAYPKFRHGPLQAELGLQDHLALPAGYNPRTLAWAAELRRRLPDAKPSDLAVALYQHIRTQGFTYTLAPGLYGQANPMAAIDEFWLDRKEGFCEHFAASFVVLMRAMDVPARIVTGFQGMDEEPVDGYYVVRQSAAHAWAEYWQAGQGWVRADPTAAVAPERIQRSLRLAPAPGFVGNAMDAIHPALLLQLRNAWEGLNNRWNQWVLNYSRGQQLDLLKRLGLESPRWQDLVWMLLVALSTLALGSAIWAWRGRHRVNPWVRQLHTLHRALRGLGLSVSACDSARTLAQRLLLRSRSWNAHQQAQAMTLVQMLESWDRQRYGVSARKHPDGKFTRQFEKQAHRLQREGLCTVQ